MEVKLTTMTQVWQYIHGLLPTEKSETFTTGQYMAIYLTSPSPRTAYDTFKSLYTGPVNFTCNTYIVNTKRLIRKAKTLGNKRQWEAMKIMLSQVYSLPQPLPEKTALKRAQCEACDYRKKASKKLENELFIAKKDLEKHQKTISALQKDKIKREKEMKDYISANEANKNDKAEIETLKTKIKMLSQEAKKKKNPAKIIRSKYIKDSNKYRPNVIRCIYKLVEKKVPVGAVGDVIQTVLQDIAKKQLDSTPPLDLVSYMASEMTCFSDEKEETTKPSMTFSFDSNSYTVQGQELNEPNSTTSQGQSSDAMQDDFHIEINNEDDDAEIMKTESNTSDEEFKEDFPNKGFTQKTHQQGASNNEGVGKADLIDDGMDVEIQDEYADVEYIKIEPDHEEAGPGTELQTQEQQDIEPANSL